MSTAAVFLAAFLAVPDPKLAAHLAAWEKAAKDVTNVRAAFTLTRPPQAFGRAENYAGVVLHLRPGSTRLRVVSASDPADYEAFISDGKRLYVYSGRSRTVIEVLTDPAADPGGADNALARLLFGRLYAEVVRVEENPVFAPLVGVPPGELTRRYSVTLFKEDANYVYLDVRPRTAADRGRFTRARWALYGPDAKDHRPYTPAQSYVAKPGGDTEVWTFTKIESNLPGIGPDDFRYVAVPGFNLHKAPVAPKP